MAHSGLHPSLLNSTNSAPNSQAPPLSNSPSNAHISSPRHHLNPSSSSANSSNQGSTLSAAASKRLRTPSPSPSLQSNAQLIFNTLMQQQQQQQPARSPSLVNIGSSPPPSHQRQDPSSSQSSGQFSSPSSSKKSKNMPTSMQSPSPNPIPASHSPYARQSPFNPPGMPQMSPQQQQHSAFSSYPNNLLNPSNRGLASPFSSPQNTIGAGGISGGMAAGTNKSLGPNLSQLNLANMAASFPPPNASQFQAGSLSRGNMNLSSQQQQQQLQSQNMPMSQMALINALAAEAAQHILQQNQHSQYTSHQQQQQFLQQHLAAAAAAAAASQNSHQSHSASGSGGGSILTGLTGLRPPGSQQPPF